MILKISQSNSVYSNNSNSPKFGFVLKGNRLPKPKNVVNQIAKEAPKDTSTKAEEAIKKIFPIIIDAEDSSLPKEKIELFNESQWIIGDVIKKYYSLLEKQLPDAVQAGFEGLLTAIQEHHGEKETFPAYGYLWVRKMIFKLLNQEEKFRTPVNLRNLENKLLNSDAYFQMQESGINKEQIAAELNMPQATVTRALKGIENNEKSVLTIDSWADDELIVKETLGQRREPLPEEEFARKEYKDVLYDIIMDKKVFTDRERDVFIPKYGLHGQSPKNAAQIAKKLDISRQRVDSLCKGIEEKIKKHMEFLQKLVDFLSEKE